MAGKLVLITDDELFSELSGQTELIQPWLDEGNADTILDQFEAPAPWIVRCDQDLLVPTEHRADDPLTDADRAYFMHNLLGGTICYLACVGASPPDDPNESQAPSRSTARHWSLGDHLDWCDRFHEELRRRLKNRHANLRHVLILICEEALPEDQYDHLVRMTTGSGDEKLFDACYVMLEELEPGSSPGLYFRAADVWPCAVDGLLVKLLHDEVRAEGAATETFAWRSYQLVPNISTPERKRLCSKCFDDLYACLTADRSPGDHWELERLTKFESRAVAAQSVDLENPQDDANDIDLRWTAYSAFLRHEQVTSPERWERSLTRAGNKLATELSRHAIDKTPNAWTEVEKIWSSVHEDPHFIYVALLDGNVGDGPALQGQYEASSKSWSEILEKEKEREDSIRHAKECAEEYHAARNAYVDVFWRVMASLAVTAALGYIVMTVFHALVGVWWVSLVVALAGAAGTLIGGVLSLDLEHRAGRRAQAALEGQFGTIDDKLRQRHRCCQDAAKSADVFCQKITMRAAVQQLKRLLRRVQTILEHELRYAPDLEEEAELQGDREGEEHLADELEGKAREAALARRRQRQRARFVRETRMTHDVANATDEEGEGPVDRYVEDHADRFREELWSVFCSRYDRRNTGNLPASRLIPRIRAFRQRFHSGLLALIRKRAIERLGNGELRKWGAEIKSILEYRAWFELMSCRLEAHQTDPQRLARLYLRKGAKFGPLKAALRGASVASDPVESDYLNDLPVCGLVFQEMPVQFSANDGKIVVGELPPRASSRKRSTRKKRARSPEKEA